MTLIELMAATTMMATIMASTVVLVRSSYAVWQATEADLEQSENACAVLRHIVRNVRQASEVLDVSSSSLTLAVSGEKRQWSFDGGIEQVLFESSSSSGSQLLAGDIIDLEFIGYEADGTTTTTVAADVQSIHCTVVVVMPSGGVYKRIVSCRAWLRSW